MGGIFKEFDLKSEGTIDVGKLSEAWRAIGQKSSHWDRTKNDVMIGQLERCEDEDGRMSGGSFVRHFSRALIDMTAHQFDKTLVQFKEVAQSQHWATAISTPQ